MAVGLVGHWKVPLGYFLTAGISAETQGQLVRQAISKLYECDIRVVALVMDGHPVNQSMLHTLGCNMAISNMKTSFLHPCDPNFTIYTFFDACHLIKLVRTALHDLQEIYIDKSKSVKWFYIAELNKTQEVEGLHAANRLTRRHINFSQQKMKVKLATQTLSNSVAKAIELLRKLGYESFSNSQPTESFITLFNDLFDIFNSRSAFGRDFKSPIKSENLNEKIKFLNDAKNRILSMKTNTGQNIYSCKKSFAFTGFAYNINSFINISLEFLGPDRVESPVQYILSYKFSQDHLELFFSSLRSVMRFNNNPNALQLCYIWRGLLSKAGLKPSFAANCLIQDDTELLCPSVSNNTSQPDNDRTLEESPFDSSTFLDISSLSLFVLDVLTYIAGWVVRQIIDKLTCTECRAAIVAKTSFDHSILLNLKNKGGLVYPSRDFVSVIRSVEKAIRYHIPNLKAKTSNTYRLQIETTVLQELPCDLFADFHDHFIHTYHDGNSHYTSLIRAICRTFLTLRLHHIAKTTNISDIMPIRQKLTKTVLFMNQ